MKSIKTRQVTGSRRKSRWQQNPTPPGLKAALAHNMTKQEESASKLMKRSEQFVKWASIGKGIKNMPDLPDCLKPH